MAIEFERQAESIRPDSHVVAGARPGALKFGPSAVGASDGFHRELRRRVEQYFAVTGLSPRDCPQMYAKTAMILLWLAASYTLLVFEVSTWWQGLPTVISLGLAMAAVGFNIQHDGGHQAYSNHLWINSCMAAT